MPADRRCCYPLTVTDYASRYLLLCEAMESSAERFAFTSFERLFQERTVLLRMTGPDALDRNAEP